MWKHHQWSTINECWQRIYCHDENDDVDKRWMVMMKWQRWQMKKSHNENEDVDKWGFMKKSSTAMNEILSWRIPQTGEKKTCFKRYNHRQEMSRLRKMITSTRGSLHVTDDKTQCIIWRSTHEEGTRWMSGSRTRKESLERKTSKRLRW